MEFVPLRSLQRGAPEVWQTLRKEHGRIVLTAKGQPAYLLVDLKGHDVVPLINMVDRYKEETHEEWRTDVLKLLDRIRDENKENELTDEEWEELENIDSKTNLSREIDI